MLPDYQTFELRGRLACVSLAAHKIKQQMWVADKRPRRPTTPALLTAISSFLAGAVQMSRTSRSSASLDRTSTSMVSFDAVPEDGADSSGSNDSLLQQLELEFSDKVGQMRELAERLALRLEHNFRSELIKLPKAVRNMPMRDFCISYGGDVDEAMKELERKKREEMEEEHERKKRSRVEDALTMPPPSRPVADAKSTRGAKQPAQAAAPPSGARSKRGRGAAAEPAASETPGARGTTRSRVAVATPGAGAKGLATPAGGTNQAGVAFTPRIGETPRPMKGGEMALSANGSPINVLNTVKARVSKRGRTAETAPAVVLAMVDGTEVDLSDHATLKGLEADGEAKDFTLSQLEQLQAQVAAHIKALKAPGGVPEI